MSLTRGRMYRRTVGGRYVDASRENGMGVVGKMTVEEAARSLGIKEESVRKRVRRGKMRSEKDAAGRLYVYVDGTEVLRDGNGVEPRDLCGDRSWEEPRRAAREAIEAKDETIRILQHQLEEEREARRRSDTIIAQLTQLNAALTARVPGLGAPPTEPPDTEGTTVATTEGVRMTSERRSWWRRHLGGG
jgi:excisionase family DNA binding protein